MNKKLIITGSSGLIGSFLKKDFIQDFRVLGIDKQSSNSTDIVLDLRKINILENVLRRERIDIIIHTAAIKDLIICQNNTQRAWDINVGVTDFLVNYAGKNGVFFVQISSDMVFDGNKGNYSESDEPSPINWYGATKYVAELLIQEKAKIYAICRTAQVFSPFNEKDTACLATSTKTGTLTNQSLFPYFVVKRLLSKKIVFAPEIISSPTPVTLLSLFIKEIIHRRATGIFHTVGARSFSRYQLALILAKEFNLPSSLIKPRNDSTAYLRPKNSSLDSSKIHRLTKYIESNYDIIECIKKWIHEKNFL